MKITSLHSTLLTLGFTRDDMAVMVPASLKMLMRLITVEEFIRVCRATQPDMEQTMNVARFNEVFDVGYYQKNVKLYLSWCVAKGLNDSWAIRQAGRQFQLLPVDRQLFNLMVDVDVDLARTKMQDDVVLYATPQEMDNAITTILTDLKAYIGKFTHRKLTFTTKGTERDKEDIHAELKVAAIRCAYKTYPFQQSELHLVNCMKRAIHNAGMNIIGSATAKKNQVLVGDGEGGFTMLKGWYDLYNDNNDEATVVGSCGLDGASKSEHTDCTTQDRITCEQVTTPLLGKARQATVILAGHYSARFSRYLRSLGIHKDNDEWSQQMLTSRKTSMKRYYEIIADYCKISYAAMDTLIAWLRQGVGAGALAH